MNGKKTRRVFGGKTLGGAIKTIKVIISLAWAYCIARIVLFLFVGSVLSIMMATEQYLPGQTEIMARAAKTHTYYLIVAIAGFVWWSVDKGVKNNKDKLSGLRKILQK